MDKFRHLIPNTQILELAKNYLNLPIITLTTTGPLVILELAHLLLQQVNSKFLFKLSSCYLASTRNIPLKPFYCEKTLLSVFLNVASQTFKFWENTENSVSCIYIDRQVGRQVSTPLNLLDSECIIMPTTNHLPPAWLKGGPRDGRVTSSTGKGELSLPYEDKNYVHDECVDMTLHSFEYSLCLSPTAGNQTRNRTQFLYASKDLGIISVFYYIFRKYQVRIGKHIYCFMYYHFFTECVLPPFDKIYYFFMFKVDFGRSYQSLAS